MIITHKDCTFEIVTCDWVDDQSRQVAESVMLVAVSRLNSRQTRQLWGMLDQIQHDEEGDVEFVVRHDGYGLPPNRTSHDWMEWLDAIASDALSQATADWAGTPDTGHYIGLLAL